MQWSYLNRRRLVLVLIVLTTVLTACTAGAPEQPPTPRPTATPVPTATPEPIIPTRTPELLPAELPPTETATLVATATLEPVATHTPPPAPTFTAAEKANLERFGVVGALEDVAASVDAGLRFGNFAFWGTSATLPDLPDVAFWQMIRVGEGRGSAHTWPLVRPEVEAALQVHPGSFWLVGNEPDVRWQDNAPAEQYAEQYHEIYQFIKERDPSAKVVAGGIALPTPLRLRYLDDVLTHYAATYGKPLPADLWHVHTFTLREESGSWGIGIPPGMEDSSGALYEIEDHGRIDLLQDHVGAFRNWMAANGYADSPLAITEWGILLPVDYGFPINFVGQYMGESLEFFRTATGETGLAADDGRLVQYWFWFIIHDYSEYTTGNLFDPLTGELTELGEIYKTYTDDLTQTP